MLCENSSQVLRSVIKPRNGLELTWTGFRLSLFNRPILIFMTTTVENKAQDHKRDADKLKMKKFFLIYTDLIWCLKRHPPKWINDMLNYFKSRLNLWRIVNFFLISFNFRVHEKSSVFSGDIYLLIFSTSPRRHKLPSSESIKRVNINRQPRCGGDGFILHSVAIDFGRLIGMIL